MNFTEIYIYKVCVRGNADAGVWIMMKMKSRHNEKKIKKEKIQKQPSRLVTVLNRYSLLFHALLACGVCFLIEWISRHSFLDACSFVVDRNLVFLYNSLIVFSSLMLVYMVRRRAVTRTLICAFWIFLGTINGCILAKRVSPFSFTDIKMVGDLFTMESNYFTDKEAMLVIGGVAFVVLLLVVFWFKGPKFQGRMNHLLSLAMIGAVVMMLPNVTNAAVSNNILTSYFENLAQGYKDYGFVYSFSSSVLDRGMSAPEEYSEESVDAVMAKLNGAADAAGVSANGQDSLKADALEKGQASLEMNEHVLTGAAQSESAKTETDAKTAPETQSDGNAENAQTDSGAVNAESDGEVISAQQESETVETQPERVGDAGQQSEESDIAGEEKIPEKTEGVDGEYPNIICVLLESFVDPGLIKFLETSEDPIPNFHYLYDNFTSGYLEVPVVGAGTANTEFEILTGMGMQFFGLGEYPYKTILKKTNCESIAADLKTLGYGAHAVHNNGGNFYSRKNAFSMMGFDTFTSKELMDIHDYTPLGTWPTDDVLIKEVEKSLDYTPEKPDFVYTITVEAHGDYPHEAVITNPDIIVSGPEDEGWRYAWEYYVNQLHEVDEFIGKLIEMLSERDEKTMVVMFGDHLPTMGLTEEDMTTGSLFKTQYVTWNNFGMEKEDKDMTSYQLLADLTDDLGIHNGTMFTFHQNRDTYTTEEEYQKDMELLQYDILYGEHYVYNGEDPYPASDIVMGTQDVTIRKIEEKLNYYYIWGNNYTKWSKVFVDDEKLKTKYVTPRLLMVKKDLIEPGFHRIVVNQMGSSDTIFRSSNTKLYTVKAQEPET